jgi:hypothetical protein
VVEPERFKPATFPVHRTSRDDSMFFASSTESAVLLVAFILNSEVPVNVRLPGGLVGFGPFPSHANSFRLQSESRRNICTRIRGRSLVRISHHRSRATRNPSRPSDCNTRYGTPARFDFSRSAYVDPKSRVAPQIEVELERFFYWWQRPFGSTKLLNSTDSNDR